MNFLFTARHRIGLGTCPVCQSAANNCVMVSRERGVPVCGHLICAACVDRIMANGTPACPICRAIITETILIN